MYGYVIVAMGVPSLLPAVRMGACCCFTEVSVSAVCHRTSLPQGSFSDRTGVSPKWKIPVPDMCQQVGGVSETCNCLY